MTAEVAVLNSHGVSLAADSAVTLGPGVTKIYTSADKLVRSRWGHDLWQCKYCWIALGNCHQIISNRCKVV